MLKITEGKTDDGKAILFLEGQITGPWLEELRRCCKCVFERDLLLMLDLSNVSFVDRTAIPFFQELEEGNVTLHNCSPFVAEQLKEFGLSLHLRRPSQQPGDHRAM